MMAGSQSVSDLLPRGSRIAPPTPSYAATPFPNRLEEEVARVVGSLYPRED